MIAQRDDPSRFDIGHAYETDWKAAFATRLHAAALFAHVCMRPSAARWLPLLRHFPGLLTFGARWSGKARLLAPRHSDAA